MEKSYRQDMERFKFILTNELFDQNKTFTLKQELNANGTYDPRLSFLKNYYLAIDYYEDDKGNNKMHIHIAFKYFMADITANYNDIDDLVFRIECKENSERGYLKICSYRNLV